MPEHKLLGWGLSASPLARLRQSARRVHKGVRAEHWFPHIPLSLAVAAGGAFLVWLTVRSQERALLSDFPEHVLNFRPASMPYVLIGFAMVVMSAGLLFRSRVSWIMGIVLTACTLLSAAILGPSSIKLFLIYYDACLMIGLLLAYRWFDRSSLAAGTLFAITSSLMLLIYAVFGSLYLGSEFAPPIRDLGTALYYSIVTMGTVGYGDIVPKTLHARMFTVSIIFLGIAVFATSISAIVGPVVTHSVDRIISGKEKRMKRANHFIIAGATPLAFNTYREIKKRNHQATLIVPEPPGEADFDDADIIVGDPNNLETLTKAGAEQAQAVLAMRADDSENAFIALAVKELKGSAKTIVAVNDSKHLERVRLAQPDYIIAPQVLGAEMLAMALNGEAITSEFVAGRFLQFKSTPPPKPPST